LKELGPLLDVVLDFDVVLCGVGDVLFYGQSGVIATGRGISGEK